MTNLGLPVLPERTRGKAGVKTKRPSFVKAPADVVRIYILLHAQQRWGCLARLFQLSALVCNQSQQIAYEFAQAGAAGVLLDVLLHAPRYHRAWYALSTAGVRLLSRLQLADESAAMEVAQPTALALMLAILRDVRSSPGTRQAVASLLRGLIVGRPVYRDKALAAGALPVVLRLLTDLPSLVDLQLVQDVIWVLISLTDPDQPSTPGLCTSLHMPTAHALVPMLHLYAQPGCTHLDHVASLAVRALHVQVAGHDVGKDLLRTSGALGAIIRIVKRHAAPYSNVAVQSVLEQQQAQRQGGGVSSSSEGSALHTGPWLAVNTRPVGHVPAGRVQSETGPANLPGSAIGGDEQGASIDSADVAQKLPGLLPAQRLLAVLLLRALMLEGVTHGRKGLASSSHRQPQSIQDIAATAVELGSDTDSDMSTIDVTPEPEKQTTSGHSGAAGADFTQQQQPTAPDAEIQAAGDDPHQHAAASLATAGPQGHGDDTVAQWLRVPALPELDAQSQLIIMTCYGLLLPLLEDTSASSAYARRLCPLRESLAALKTLLCDNPANQDVVMEAGLVELVVNMVARGDMGLAWQAAEVAVHLAASPLHAATLIQAGAVEELSLLLQETASALHGLTLRKQIHESAAVAESTIAGPPGAPTTGRTRASGSGDVGGSSGGSGSSMLGLSLLSQVHVRPGPAMLKPQRVFLVGRLDLDFTTSSCLYHAHTSPAFCDYCTPSAAIKALLRLTVAVITSTGEQQDKAEQGVERSSNSTSAWLRKDRLSSQQQQQRDSISHSSVGEAYCTSSSSAAAIASANSLYGCREVARRFTVSGGLHGLLLLLQHEAAGVHHSKLASSLVALLSMVLRHEPSAQDAVRSVGGVGVILTLLYSMLRPGVMDVYQLRAATAEVLGHLLTGNAANRLCVRELGGLQLLTSLLATALSAQHGDTTGTASSGVQGGRKVRKSTSHQLDASKEATSFAVVDDASQLAGATLRAMAAAADGSTGNQDTLMGTGALHWACHAIGNVAFDDALRREAVLAVSACVDGHPQACAMAIASGSIQAAVAWSFQKGAAGPEAAATAGLLIKLLHGSSKGSSTVMYGPQPEATPSSTRQALVKAGTLSMLLAMVGTPFANASSASLPMTAQTVSSEACHTALSVLHLLVEGDVERQNDVIAAGVMDRLAVMLTHPATAMRAMTTPPALRLLSALLAGNTYAKNAARAAGVAARLVVLLRAAYVEGCYELTGTCACVLAEMAAGNHASQAVVVEDGGMDVAVELARASLSEACMVHESLLSDAIDPARAAEAAAEASAVTSTGGAYNAFCISSSSSSSSSSAMAHAKLLSALFRLLCSLVDLHPTNMHMLCQLGGVATVADFVLNAAAVATHRQLHENALMPAIGWACRTLRALCQGGSGSSGSATASGIMGGAYSSGGGALGDSSSSLHPMVISSSEGSFLGRSSQEVVASGNGAAGDLAVDAVMCELEQTQGLVAALVTLLEVEDASIACDVARALEWVSFRNSLPMEASTPRSNTSTTDAEAHLIQTLVRLLYSNGTASSASPSSTGLLSSTPGMAADATATLARTSAGSAFLTQGAQRAVAAAAGTGAFVGASHMGASVRGGGGGGATAASVQEASGLLQAVVSAAEAVLVQEHAHLLPQLQQPGAASQTSQTSMGWPGIATTRVVTAPAAPHSKGHTLSSQASTPNTAINANQPAQAQGHHAHTQAHAGLPGLSFQAAAGSSAAAAGLLSHSGLLGNAVSAASRRAYWQALAGRSAQAFAKVAAQVRSAAGSGGPARGRGSGGGSGGSGSSSAVKELCVQLTWLLFLMALKASAHRAALLRMVRTALEPLAQQLVNAEAGRAQLEAAAAAAAAAAEAGLAAGSATGSPSGASADVSSSQHTQQQPINGKAASDRIRLEAGSGNAACRVRVVDGVGNASGSGLGGFSSVGGQLPVSMPAADAEVGMLTVPMNLSLAPSPSPGHSPCAAHLATTAFQQASGSPGAAPYWPGYSATYIGGPAGEVNAAAGASPSRVNSRAHSTSSAMQGTPTGHGDSQLGASASASAMRTGSLLNPSDPWVTADGPMGRQGTDSWSSPTPPSSTRFGGNTDCKPTPEHGVVAHMLALHSSTDASPTHHSPAEDQSQSYPAQQLSSAYNTPTGVAQHLRPAANHMQGAANLKGAESPTVVSPRGPMGLLSSDDEDLSMIQQEVALYQRSTMYSVAERAARDAEALAAQGVTPSGGSGNGLASMLGNPSAPRLRSYSNLGSPAIATSAASAPAVNVPVSSGLAKQPKHTAADAKARP